MPIWLKMDWASILWSSLRELTEIAKVVVLTLILCRWLASFGNAFSFTSSSPLTLITKRTETIRRNP